jgi:hypothetical protein
MARSPSPDRQAYTNPEVRFERTDITARGIVLYGVVFGGGAAVIALAMTWFGHFLVRAEQPLKKTDLPEARVDADRLPPEPRLEAIEDVRRDDVKLHPPRAAEFLQPQERTLVYGDEKKGVLPIEKAIADLAWKLPVRKARPATPPTPSDTGSGRQSSGEAKR